MFYVTNIHSKNSKWIGEVHNKNDSYDSCISSTDYSIYNIAIDLLGSLWYIVKHAFCYATDLIAGLIEKREIIS